MIRPAASLAGLATVIAVAWVLALAAFLGVVWGAVAIAVMMGLEPLR